MKKRNVSDARVQRCLAYLEFLKKELAHGEKSIQQIFTEFGWSSAVRINVLLKIDHMIVKRGTKYVWDTIDPTPIMARKLCIQDNVRWGEQEAARKKRRKEAKTVARQFKAPTLDKGSEFNDEVKKGDSRREFVDKQLYEEVRNDAQNSLHDIVTLKKQNHGLELKIQNLLKLCDDHAKARKAAEVACDKLHEETGDSKRDLLRNLNELSRITIKNERKPKRKGLHVLSITLFGFELTLYGSNRNS